MPYARTDDRVRIYYEIHGPTEATASGTPLVLAYGIGGNADLWDVNIPALAARRRVVLWEPRGHARSDSPEDPARYSSRSGPRSLTPRHLARRAHVAAFAGRRMPRGSRSPVRAACGPARHHSSSAAGPLSVDNIVIRARSSR